MNPNSFLASLGILTVFAFLFGMAFAMGWLTRAMM